MYTNVRAQAADLLEEAGDYVKTVYQLVSIKLSRKTVVIISGLIADFAVMVAAVICLLFLSIAAAFLIGKYVQDTAQGFLWVGAFYFVLFLFLLLLKKRVILPYLRNFITSRMNEKKDKSI
jgi:hypothetical protein